MYPIRAPGILVIAAMREEIVGLIGGEQPFSRAPGDPMAHYWESREYGGFVGFFCCGVGRKRARRNLSKMLGAIQPQKILIVGYSGSLLAGGRVGDVILADTTCCESIGCDATIEFDRRFSGEISSYLDDSLLRYNRGGTVTVDRIVDTATDKHDLHRLSGAACVDMESYYIVTSPGVRDTPAAMLRVISDHADESLGLDLNSIPAGKWRSRRYFLLHPRTLPGLIRLRRNMRTATDQLTRFLRCILAGDQPRR